MAPSKARVAVALGVILVAVAPSPQPVRPERAAAVARRWPGAEPDAAQAPPASASSTTPPEGAPQAPERPPERRTGRGSAQPAPSPPESLSAALACIREGESHNNYAENTGNGYYGAFQFAPRTWNASTRGAGHPEWANGRADLAPPEIQDAAAAWLAVEVGWGQWPVTSRRCGLR